MYRVKQWFWLEEQKAPSTENFIEKATYIAVRKYSMQFHVGTIHKQLFQSFQIEKKANQSTVLEVIDLQMLLIDLCYEYLLFVGGFCLLM